MNVQVFDHEGSSVGSGDSKTFDYATTLAEVTKTSKVCLVIK